MYHFLYGDNIGELLFFGSELPGWLMLETPYQSTCPQTKAIIKDKMNIIENNRKNTLIEKHFIPS